MVLNNSPRHGRAVGSLFQIDRGHTFLGLFTDEKRDTADTTTIYPDRENREGFGVPSLQVCHKKDLRAAMSRFSRKRRVRARSHGSLHGARTG
jgi:hypothetical protein